MIDTIPLTSTNLYSIKSYGYLQSLYENVILDESESKVFRDTINNLPISDINKSKLNIHLVLRNLLGNLESWDYNNKNEAVEYLRNNIAQLLQLDIIEQEKLGYLIISISSERSEGYDGTSQRATDFIKDIPESTPPYMALGIFKELFKIEEKNLKITRTYIDFPSLAKILSKNFNQEVLKKHFEGIERIQLADVKFIEKVSSSDLECIAVVLDDLSKGMRT